MKLPPLYAILSTDCFQNDEELLFAAEELVAAGVNLLQYRHKFLPSPSRPSQAAAAAGARHMLDHVRELKKIVGRRAKLIMNDRADLCLAANFDGLHLGQDDLSPDAARRIIGQGSDQTPRILGLSTHNPEQLAAADQTDADYLAIGPVFITSSKLNPDPVVGLDGIRRARALTRKPLVAIGGITRANARSVIDAGADSVAVISDLLPNPRKSAEEFLRLLG